MRVPCATWSFADTPSEVEPVSARRVFVTVDTGEPRPGPLMPAEDRTSKRTRMVRVPSNASPPAAMSKFYAPSSVAEVTLV